MFTRWRLPPDRLDELVVRALLQARLLEHPLHGRAGSSTPSRRANSRRFCATVSFE